MPGIGQKPLSRGWQISTRTAVGVGLMALVIMAGVWEAARYGVTDGAASVPTSTAVATGSSVSPTVDTTIPQPGVVRFFDSFTRPDSLETLGSDEPGRGWDAVRGTWGIQDGAAYISKSFTRAPLMSLAVAEGEVSDGVFSAVVGGDGVCGLMVRYVDPKNFVVVKRVPLYRVWNIEEFKNGKSERLGFLVDQTADALQVVVGYRGSSITVSVAGVVHPVVETSLTTSTTAIGLLGEGPTGEQCRWRDATLASTGT